MGNKTSEEQEPIPGIVTVVAPVLQEDPKPHPLKVKLDERIVVIGMQDKPLLMNPALAKLGLDEERLAQMWNTLKDGLEQKAEELNFNQAEIRGKIRVIEKIVDLTLGPSVLASLVLTKRIAESTPLLSDFQRMKCDLINLQSEVDELCAKTVELDYILNGRLLLTQSEKPNETEE